MLQANKVVKTFEGFRALDEATLTVHLLNCAPLNCFQCVIQEMGVDLKLQSSELCLPKRADPLLQFL